MLQNQSQIWKSQRECAQGTIDGGFQTVFRVLSGDRIPLPPFNLDSTQFLLQFLFTVASFFILFEPRLNSVSSGISDRRREKKRR